MINLIKKQCGNNQINLQELIPIENGSEMFELLVKKILKFLDQK